jgi:hypothetical protein
MPCFYTGFSYICSDYADLELIAGSHQAVHLFNEVGVDVEEGRVKVLVEDADALVDGLWTLQFGIEDFQFTVAGQAVKQFRAHATPTVMVAQRSQRIFLFIIYSELSFNNQMQR